ncbi:MAG TPA: type II toxin-antitoxin system MqsA family antitoxin [Desulfuromonadales bacterium]|nr:type II toxin-antitoxin system MqsA family antitoxin [Desulfuromonadales bacterium]
MTNNTKINNCPLCKGHKKVGHALFSVDMGFGVVVVRHVPATVCDQCGAEWFSDSVAAKLEAIVAEARAKKALVEVTSLDDLPLAA